MKKKILIGFGVFFIAALFTFNIILVKNGNNGEIALTSLVKMAFADDEGQNCPGGSCTFTQYRGGEVDWECSACCPEGKNPSCSTLGCSCQ